MYVFFTNKQQRLRVCNFLITNGNKVSKVNVYGVTVNVYGEKVKVHGAALAVMVKTYGE